MANLTRTTRDHEENRRWAEERGGKPSHVKRTGSGEDVGILRIDFPGYSGEGSLEPITWEQWFEKFDKENLSLIYEEVTAGGERSNFNKIVGAETAKEAESKSRGTGTRGGVKSRRAPAKGGGGKRAATKKASKTGSSRSAGLKKAGGKKAAKKVAKRAIKKAAPKAVKKSGAKSAKKFSAKKSAPKKSAGKKRR